VAMQRAVADAADGRNNRATSGDRRDGLGGPVLFCFCVLLTEAVVQPPMKIPYFQRRLFKGGCL